VQILPGIAECPAQLKADIVIGRSGGDGFHGKVVQPDQVLHPLGIGMRLCEEGIPVRFFRTAALINQLSEHKRSGTLSKFLKKLNKAEVLILDEFGYVPYDRMGSQLLFDYMSEIHEKKQVILNTNLEFSRWVNVLYDEQMTAALIGRLTHHCHLILFPGGNNRLRESSLNETYHEIAARTRTEEKDHD
jgi:hypothetical protein